MTPFRNARNLTLFALATALAASTALIATPGQAAEPALQVGDCLTVDDPWSSTSAFTAVDCAERHNSEIYDLVDYPADAGAPSTLTEQELQALADECSWDAFDVWLGTQVTLPMRIWRWYVSAPSDEAWEAGDRTVACRTVRPTNNDSAMAYSGPLPELIASTPLLQWLNCLTKAPKSGAPNRTVGCTAKSGWLLLGGASVKGKVTAKYPRDLQTAADKACSALGKKFGKPGTRPIAALLPKEWVDPASVFTECFVPLARWNGKGR